MLFDVDRAEHKVLNVRRLTVSVTTYAGIPSEKGSTTKCGAKIHTSVATNTARTQIAFTQRLFSEKSNKQKRTLKMLRAPNHCVQTF